VLRKTLVIATLCAAGLVLCASGANAQCSARHVQQNAVALKSALVPANSAGVREGGAALRVWKTITLGEFANSFTLRNALDAAGCGIGDLAEEILARPTFTLAATKTGVDLVVVSAAELGLSGESVSLIDIYSRAEQFGLTRYTLIACCALAANGHVVAAPPIRPINSRRFMSAPKAQDKASYRVKMADRKGCQMSALGHKRTSPPRWRPGSLPSFGKCPPIW
jgi:hypothetical protein